MKLASDGDGDPGVSAGSAARVGVLLINLGTPDSPAVGDVRRYLREFLMDPRVVDLPLPLRWALVHLLILPLRPRRSAEAYRAIWGRRGSPLLSHGEDLRDGVAARLGDGAVVVLAMRYGRPSIAAGLDALAAAGVDRVVALPLFPQYASASHGSAAARAMTLAAERWNVPALHVLPAFPDDPRFIEATARVAEAALAARDIAVADLDHVLLSFHGVPERHVRRSDSGGGHCLQSAHCCDTLGAANRACYRAQCFATGRALAHRLGLANGQWSVAFQSRLGRTPWIGPYTDAVIDALGQQRLRRVAVLEPSFVADCLETLEEIGLRGRERFVAAGGGELLLLPCVNAAPAWCDAVAAMIAEACPGLQRALPAPAAAEMSSASRATATTSASST